MDRSGRDFERYLKQPTRKRLEKVIRHYHDLVWRTAYRVTSGHTEDAEDICQDVFLKLLLDPPAPGSVRTPEAYLVWRVVGRAANLRRAQDRRREREAEAKKAAVEDSVPAGNLDSVSDAVSALSEDLRNPLWLRYFAGLSNREIASAMGIAERTVEERLHRAREVLRKSLAGAPVVIAALAATLECEASPPPDGYLERLLRVAKLGSALLAMKTAVPVGGALATKKAFLAVSAGLVLLLVPASVAVWNGRDNQDEPASRSGVAQRAPLTREATEEVAGLPPLSTPQADLPARTSPRSILRGLVRDEEERPVAGVVLRLRLRDDAAGAALEAVSDEVGEYTFQEAPAGRVSLTGEKEGYLLLRPELHLPIEEGKTTDVNVRLYRPHRLSGRITDPSGAPLAEGELWVNGEAAGHFPKPPPPTWPSSGFDHWRRFPADPEGQYDTGRGIIINDGFKSESFAIRVAARGFATRAQIVRRPEFQDGEARLDFVLEPEMPITLLVADPAGRRVEGAEVGLGSEDSWHGQWQLYGVGVTDVTGRAVLPRHPQEQHRLRVEKQGYRAASVVVEPGASMDIPVVLNPLGPGVSGHITFDDAFPEDAREVGDLYFECRDENGKLNRLYRPQGKRDKATLEFAYWPQPGRYTLRVELGLLSYATEPFEYNGLEPVRADIHVPLEPPFLAGTAVRAGTGEPLAKVSVTARFVEKGEEFRSSWGRTTVLNGFHLSKRPGNGQGTKTNTDGKFVLMLPRDNGRQQFWSPRSSVASVLAGSDEVGWSEDFVLEFDRNTAVNDLRLEVFSCGSLEGIVTDEAGQPAVGELVVASDFQGTTSWSQTDRQGHYRISNLRAGEYLVAALGRCSSPQAGSGMGGGSMDDLPPPHQLIERPVPISSGEATRYDLDVKKDRPGRIEGTLGEELSEGGTAICAMVLRGVPRRPQVLCRKEEIHGRSFRLEVLLPGTYRVTILGGAPQAVLAEADVEVRRGAVARVHLEPPAAAVRIPFAGQDGSPLPGVQVTRVERLIDGAGSELVGGHTVTQEGGFFKVARLPRGSVRALLQSPGHVAAWSEPVLVAEAAEATAPPVVLERGQEIHVRLEPAAGWGVLKEPQFRVAASAEGPFFEHLSVRSQEEPVWVLSSFLPGTYELSVSAGEFPTARTPVIVPAGGAIEITVPPPSR